ncbi:MAG: CoA pyrophosphatase [Myxococcota bacterium]|nr:CoA pyrophosphatase [Myxococcota bacterium]
MPRPSDIAQRMGRYQPNLVEGDDRARAAVAVVLRGLDDDAEVLFIERATRTGDPWSGHMALPGGRLDPGDAGTQAAAERETLEEVGVRLADGSYLGRLDDLEGRPERNDRMVVSAYVYHTATSEPLLLNHEVREAFWFPVSELLAAERQVTYPHATYGGKQLPGILVGVPERQIVWGLTYRFLDIFLSVVGKPLPNSWMDLR